MHTNTSRRISHTESSHITWKCVSAIIRQRHVQLLDDVENKFNIWNASSMNAKRRWLTRTQNTLFACVLRCVSHPFSVCTPFFILSVGVFFSFPFLLFIFSLSTLKKLSSVNFTGSDKWSCYVKILCACISISISVSFALLVCRFSLSGLNLKFNYIK